MDGGQKGCALLFLPALRIQIWPQAGRGWAGKGASISSQSENLATNFRGRGEKGERNGSWISTESDLVTKWREGKCATEKGSWIFFRIRNWDKI